MKRSVLLIEARFYDEIADALAEGAIAELDRQGVAYERYAVPGALEIPVALSMACARGLVGPGSPHQGCVALGCVIRGETSHYDIVAGESASGLMRVAMEEAIPVGNGILTVETFEQALARARPEEGDKGRHAVQACLDLMRLDEAFEAAQPPSSR
jgi:6,7-dimethyl-8-ribityllumazine synthase